MSLVNAATGVATVIAAPPPGGWGLMTGVAVNNAVASYGSPSDGQNRYWFENFPNPGGQPTVGNQGFSLTSRSKPGTAVWTGFLLSATRGSTPLLGANILVGLGGSIGWSIPSAKSTTIPIPIPNVASLSGAVLTAQTLHVETGPALAFEASRGLTFTIQ